MNTFKNITKYIALCITPMILASACVNDDGPSAPGTVDTMTKEIAAQLNGRNADNQDICAQEGWYDDDVCDTFCANPDPKCTGDNGHGGDIISCSDDGVSCGDPCSTTDPNDTNHDPNKKEYCNAQGACTTQVPVCEMTYDACADKACGDGCTVCDPNDSDCVETAVVKQCNADGVCQAGPAPTCTQPYDGCAGKMCGDNCTVCDPNDSDCVETTDIKFCGDDGTCQSGPAPACVQPYDACADKACGDGCTICDPNDSECVETAVAKQCNAEGMCDAIEPMCL